MTAKDLGKVLFVDDEPHLLSAIKRNFRRSFDLETAESGALGLKCIREKGPFAVVVSDMQMPEMDGAQFLGQVKKYCPDTIRIMLTGDAGQGTAVAAINKADVYKFINKPCDQKTLETVLVSALNEHGRRQLESTLLEKTVQGSISILTELLGLTMPEVFGRSHSIKAVAENIATKLEYRTQWKLKAACMLSHIGGVSMSRELTQKLCGRNKLNEAELQEYLTILNTSANLVEKIPRLEPVADVIRKVLVYADSSGVPELPDPEEIPVESKIIRLAFDIDDIQDLEADEKIEAIKSNKHKYDPVVLEATLAYLETQTAPEQSNDIEYVSVRRLTDNMILAEDIIDRNGVLLVCSGWQTTENIRLHLQNVAVNGNIDFDIPIRRIPEVDDLATGDSPESTAANGKH